LPAHRDHDQRPDREIEGTRGEVALWTIFWALDPRYDQGAAR